MKLPNPIQAWDNYDDNIYKEKDIVLHHYMKTYNYQGYINFIKQPLHP